MDLERKKTRATNNTKHNQTEPKRSEQTAVVDHSQSAAYRKYVDQKKDELLAEIEQLKEHVRH